MKVINYVFIVTMSFSLANLFAKFRMFDRKFCGNSKRCYCPYSAEHSINHLRSSIGISTQNLKENENYSQQLNFFVFPTLLNNK